MLPWIISIVWCCCSCVPTNRPQNKKRCHRCWQITKQLECCVVLVFLPTRVEGVGFSETKVFSGGNVSTVKNGSVWNENVISKNSFQQKFQKHTLLCYTNFVNLLNFCESITYIQNFIPMIDFTLINISMALECHFSLVMEYLL